MSTNVDSLDNALLEAYLSEHIEGFRGPVASRKFSGGQSNPTFLLETPDRKYVLRRQPPGKLNTLDQKMTDAKSNKAEPKGDITRGTKEDNKQRRQG